MNTESPTPHPAKESARSRLIDSTASRILTITLFGILVGTVAAIASLLFVELVERANDWLLISARSRMMTEHSDLLPWITIAVPCIGGLIVGLLLYFFTPGASPEGPPDVIRAVQARRGKMSVRSGLVNTLAAMVSLGAGASAGHYGPLSHLGALAGSGIARLTRTPGLGTVGIGCGVAAAISAAFNAPIAGLVFAHEVVLRHYSLRAFAPITVASTMGFIMANMVFKTPPLFRVEDVRIEHPAEYVAFVAVGIAGAFVAVAFMRSIALSRRIADGLSIAPWAKPALAGAALGVIAIMVPDILGIGRETLRFGVIEDAFGGGELVAILLLKILVTALCLGFGFVGGVFSPALVIGVLLGAILGTGVELIAGDTRSSIAVYAICGMVAVASPVIGAPLTAILIVFELTRNYELTTAVMVAVVFSNVVSYRIFGRSWFDVQLINRGFDLSLGRDRVVLEEEHVLDVVHQKYTRVDSFETFERLRELLVESGNTDAHVVGEDDNYIGTISIHQLIAAQGTEQERTQLAGDAAQPAQLMLTGEDSIWEAMERIGHFVGENIPVIRTDSDDTLIGVVTEADIIRRYMDTVYELRREENASS